MKRKRILTVPGYPIVRENDIKKVISDWLDWNGFFHFPILQGLGSYPGITDRIALKDGQVFFIETKRPADLYKPARWKKGTQTPKQEKFQEDIEAKQGNYLLIHDVEGLQHAISEIWTRQDE